MGRHEIRLRRKKMTSRRIESHKNYHDILKQHEKSSGGKRVVRLIIYVLILLGLLLVAYFTVKVVRAKDEKRAYNEYVENTSRPDDFINVTRNMTDNGKT
ncbi:hypothetical protein LVD15_06510 [Fulvivirga maritima]|uniref:hypothetical protein n=1 Tax=Fulvivirga maritima TaxID=2904247 RepID=UPI001F19E719|nr:hypothetical protein [Fulvivirga maritima]UII28074.1 hypothetical protein LVD15_06510 [Fulvivirga maritima]